MTKVGAINKREEKRKEKKKKKTSKLGWKMQNI